MYEVGEYVGDGRYSVFFRIKNHPLLGIKIRIKESGYNGFKRLENEYHKGVLLYKLGVPVPKYVGIIQVKIPEKTTQIGGYENIFSNKRIRIMREEAKQSGLGPNEYVATGLVMEFIDGTTSLISRNDVKDAYNIECKKIIEKGIKMIDSDESNGLIHNVLWSKKKNQIYFIDTEYWDLSKYHETIEKQVEDTKFPENIVPKKPKSFLRRMFGR